MGWTARAKVEITHVIKVAGSPAKTPDTGSRVRGKFDVQLRLLELLVHEGERCLRISVREGDRVEGFRVIGYKPL